MLSHTHYQDSYAQPQRITMTSSRLYHNNHENECIIAVELSNFQKEIDKGLWLYILSRCQKPNLFSICADPEASQVRLDL